MVISAGSSVITRLVPAFSDHFTSISILLAVATDLGQSAPVLVEEPPQVLELKVVLERKALAATANAPAFARPLQIERADDARRR